MCIVTYDQEAAKTDRYNLDLPPDVFYALGLAGETGELVDKVKKLHRDKGGQFTGRDKQALLLEAGDVLWYLTRLVAHFGSSLDEVAAFNLLKLADREERGVLNGEGDDR